MRNSPGGRPRNLVAAIELELDVIRNSGRGYALVAMIELPQLYDLDSRELRCRPDE